MRHTLQITVDDRSQTIVLHLDGRVDIESSPDLRNRLLAILRKPSPLQTVIIDLKEVSYIDASGIATLIEGLRNARIASIAMDLQGLKGRLLHLFQATGISSLFDTTGSTNHRSTTAVP